MKDLPDAYHIGDYLDGVFLLVALVNQRDVPLLRLAQVHSHELPQNGLPIEHLAVLLLPISRIVHYEVSFSEQI